MPRIQTTTQTLYQFNELSDDAKDKAREWYREAFQHDEWWDATYEDAAQCGAILGIELRQKPVKLMNGATRYDPCIYFSGFSSQGDGACFEGSYSYAKGATKKIRTHTGNSDLELARIADELQDIQRRNFYRATMNVRQRGHYNHSGCMECTSVDGCAVADEGPLLQCLRDFADWIYGRLNTEWDWLNSDATVDDNICANEYEFTESGERA